MDEDNIPLSELAVALKESREMQIQQKAEHDKHERILEEVADKHGYKVVNIAEDGDCLLKSVLQQTHSRQTVIELREQCSQYFLDHIEELLEFYPSQDENRYKAEAEEVKKGGNLEHKHL